jgi:ABC-2 type transport system ATP-binding protein
MASGNGSPTAPAIEVRELVKDFGEVQAVRGVSFDVAPGEVFGFLGPNGAGKTTTINMLCTLTTPTAGGARVAGHDVVRERDDVRRNIGLVFQDPTLDGYMTGAQNLKLHAELYGLQRDLVEPRMRQVLEMVGLWERRDSPAGAYSGGMRRRLEIARGMMHSPRVLFLDEPTIGLDPQTRRSIWSYIRELKEREEITIFMTTHYMDEAEWCDRIAIMDNGELVAEGTSAELKREVAGDVVTVGLNGATPKAATLLEGQPYVTKMETVDGGLRLYVDAGATAMPQILRTLDGSNITLASIELHRPSLDDVFLAKTGRSLRDTAGEGA